ncbi:hypothetical protein AB0H31_39785, partial [Amycolatopsis japonica]
EVEELYMHCAKAFLRSSLWKPETWPERAGLPTRNATHDPLGRHRAAGGVERSEIAAKGLLVR